MSDDTTPGGRIDREAVRQMHAQNMNLSAIAAHFDVSRERIRQVVQELGLKPRLELIAERNAQILDEAAASFSDEELAAKFDISAAMVGLVRRQNGFSSSQFREERMTAAIERVKEGASIRAAADEFFVSPGTLASRLNKAGLKSKHGRWGALEHRREIIPQMLAEGADWSEILARLNEIEKRKIAYVTLRVWIKNHMPEIDMPSVETMARKRTQEPQAQAG